MAIQLPEIKRNMEAPGPASAGRIESKYPDMSGETAQMTEGLSRLGNTAFNMAKKHELDAIDDEKLKAKIAYNDWYKRKIEGDSATGELGLQHIQGDPTEAYNAFDKEAKEKFDEILNNPNLSDYARGAVEVGLLEAYNSNHSNRLVTYGNQHAKYQADLTESAVNLEIDEGIGSMQFVDVNDPKSTALFQEKLAGVRRTLINYGHKSGAVIDAEDGDVKDIDGDGRHRTLKMDPALKVMMKKSFSKMTGTSIDVLIDSKKLPEAKMMMEEFSNYMDGATKAKLMEKFEEKRIEYGANDLLGKYADKPYSVQLELLKKHVKTDPEMAQKAIEKVINVERNMDNLKKLSQEQAAESIMNDALDYLKKTDAVRPANYTGVDDLVIRGVRLGDRMKGLSPKQKKDVYEEFIQPKESDEDVYTEMLDASMSGELIGMPATQLSAKLTGLNTEDRRYWQKVHKNLNDPATPAEERSARAEDLRIMNIRLAPHLKNATGGRGLSKKSQRLKKAALITVLDNPTPKGQDPNKYIRDLISTHVLKERNTPEELPTQPTAPAPSPKSQKKPFSKMSVKEKDDVAQAFKDANGGKEHSDSRELMDWYNRQ